MILDEAIIAAGNGWPVFPCSADTKRPMLKSDVAGEGGLKLATTNSGQVKEWFSKWPKALIGMRTGHRSQGGAGVFVIDLDPIEGDSARLLERLRQKLADLKAETEGLGPAATIALSGAYAIPPCPMVETPRGGLHLWFKYPDALEGGELLDIGNRANLLRGYAEQVDIRGNGGYVIIPPSTRGGAQAIEEKCDGKSYQWAEGSGFFELDGAPDAPPEVLRLVLERHQAPGEARPESHAPAARPAPVPLSSPRDGSPRDRAIVRFVAAALERETAKVAGAGKGSRNAALNNAALALGHHVGAGRLAEDDVRDALLYAAEQSGLIKDDGMRAAVLTLNSGLSAGIADPADYAHVGLLAGQSSRPPPIDAVPDYIASRSSRSSHGEARGGFDEGPGISGDSGGGSGFLPPEGGSGADGDDGGDDGQDAIVEACLGFELNDRGNGQRLREWFGPEFINVDIAENPNSGFGIHTWTGTHWDQTTGFRRVQRLAHKAAENINLEAEALEMTDREKRLMEEAKRAERTPEADRGELEREAIGEGKRVKKAFQARRTARRKFAVASGNGPKQNHMINSSLPYCTIQPDELDRDPHLINVANGTLEVSAIHDPECPDAACTGEGCARRRAVITLRPHDRRDLISKVMPVAYDPAATCPKFTAFLEKVQPNDGIRNFLRRWHGLGLTGFTEQAFILNYGTGANGKSTFVETIARLMGHYAQTLPAEALVGDQQRRGDQATPELARLAGARMVRAGELPRGQNFRESTLKLLTGGDPMPVRQLHGKFWDLVPVFKASGSCNEKPEITGVDEGIWRRVKLVPWETMIPIHDRRKFETVLAEFKEENSGILNWLLDGLRDYLENDFVIPKEVREATESYREDQDPVGSFVAACVTILAPGADSEEDQRPMVSARSMYEAFTAYCHANSIRAFSQKNFAHILLQKGIKRHKRSTINYLDVQLHDVPEDPDKNQRWQKGPPSGSTEPTPPPPVHAY